MQSSRFQLLDYLAYGAVRWSNVRHHRRTLTLQPVRGGFYKRGSDICHVNGRERYLADSNAFLPSANSTSVCNGIGMTDADTPRSAK